MSQYGYPPGYPPGQGYGYQQPPAYDKPGVYSWYIAYCVLMALMYLVVMGAGIFLMVVADEMPRSSGDPPPELLGIIYAVISLPLMVAFIIGAFVPRRPWGWVYGLVMICLGLTSICCLPMTIPLLIYWLKPEAKAFFGKQTQVSYYPPPGQYGYGQQTWQQQQPPQQQQWPGQWPDQR